MMRKDMAVYVVLLIIAMALFYFLGRVEGHEFYADKMSPGFGGACCNEVDCAPLGSDQVRLNEDTGELEIQLRGRWWPAMDPQWYLGDSPDGSWHGCMMPKDQVPRCAWGGMGS
jgi:hypothetical protein